MNENIDLTKILKDCPRGTKLYSLIFGEVEFYKIDNDEDYSIGITYNGGNQVWITSDGRFLKTFDGECTLFPSKDQRDWSKFKVKQHKFDPAILKPFDKVLARDTNSQCWKPQLFSYIIKYEEDYPYLCTNDSYKYCIPYNDETKYLVGTTKEAPEYYRYWED